jgi:hypothetical protein
MINYPTRALEFAPPWIVLCELIALNPGNPKK